MISDLFRYWCVLGNEWICSLQCQVTSKLANAARLAIIRLSQQLFIIFFLCHSEVKE